MDESAQQAVSLGVNLTIFITALTVAISLMMAVKNTAENAYEFDASLPNGSRILSVEEQNKRTIKGYELISYYANYMTDINNNEAYLSDVIEEGDVADKNGKFEIIIQNSKGQEKINGINKKNSGQEFNQFFETNGIDLNNIYEVIMENYNSEEQFLTIVLKEIE